MNVRLPGSLIGSLALALCSSTTPAQQCPLLVDINPKAIGLDSDPQPESDTGEFAYANGLWFFSAHVGNLGRELYATDGTSAGTYLVADINPTGHGAPRGIRAVGNDVYFFADDGVRGRSLWKSDGTPAGTIFLKELENTAFGLQNFQSIALGGQLIFHAYTPATGHEVWTSDGTPAGTHILVDIIPGAGSSQPNSFCLDPSGNRVLFVARDIAHGVELWSTDGTTGGTSLFKDLIPGTASGNPTALHSLGNKTCFSTLSPSQVSELWVSDGTSAGTHAIGVPELTQINLTWSAELAGSLYFRAHHPSTGLETWKTDGTAAGTLIALDAAHGPTSSSPRDYILAGDRLYFSANGGGNIGRELYSIHAAGNGGLVANIAPNSGDSMQTLFAGAIGNKLCFGANDHSTGLELWTTDGTLGGTQLLSDLYPGLTSGVPNSFTPMPNGSLLFGARTAQEGTELRITDGTLTGTNLLADLNPLVIGSSAWPTNLVSLNGSQAIFTATENVGEPGLWSWDATGGATLLHDFGGAEPPVTIGKPTPVWLGDREVAFFSVDHHFWTSALWLTDGTAAGTVLVKTITPAAFTDAPRNFFGFQNRVYFSADSGNGFELHVSDGTTAGTYQLRDINQGQGQHASSDPRDWVVFADELYFVASQDSSVDLWKTDGTQSGTKLVAPFTTDPVVFQDKLYASSKTPTFGAELYSLTAFTSTLLLTVDVIPGSISSFPRSLFVLGDKLFFRADQAGGGSALYSFDGSGSTATELTGFPVHPGNAKDSVVIGSTLYMSFDEGQGNPGLWKTDGTTAGTQLLLDTPQGPTGSYIRGLTSTGSGLYFSMASAQLGSGLWYSDGTVAGTSETCSAGAVTNSEVLLVDGSLVFASNSASAGNELFWLPVAGAYSTDLGLGGDASKLTTTAPVIGKAMTLAVKDVPAGSLSLLVQSVPVAGPSSFLTVGSASWIDPGSASLVGWSLSTDWSISPFFPTVPSLIGFQLNMQVYNLPGGSFPATTSNGLSLVVGS